MYRWVFISIYQYYSRFKNESPKVAATLIVTLSQFFILMFLLIALRKMTGFDIFKYAGNKYVVLAALAGWSALLYRFYSPERIKIWSDQYRSFFYPKTAYLGCY